MFHCTLPFERKGGFAQKVPVTLFLLGCMLPGQVEAAPGEDVELEVRRLVRQLNAPRLAEREEAEQQLLQLGPEVLDQLPKITARTPAEVQTRLDRIRQKLQRAAAESAARASSITLQADALPLSKVLEAFAEQSGNRIVDYRQRFGQQVTDPALKVDFDKVPFWKALDQLLDQALLTVYPFGDEGTISLVTRGENQRPRAAGASYAGPFRLEPTKIVARRDLRDPAGQMLVLTLEASWEPRLKPIALVQKLADLTATDENGQRLPLDDSSAEFEAAVDNTSTVELLIPLQLPPRSVGQIAQLKGRLTTILPGRVETFSFHDLLDAKEVEKQIAGVVVTVDQVRRNNDLWQVRMRVRFEEAGPALESHRGWIFNNEAYLEDPHGKRVEFDVFETTRQTKNEVGIAYGFVLDNPPAGYKFIYKTPALIVATGFDYEINAVELP